MSIRKQLEAQRAVLLEQIAAAAKDGDSAVLLGRSGELRVMEEVLVQFERAEEAGARILKDKGPSIPRGVPSEPGSTLASSLSGREAGKAIRSGFLEKAGAAGLQLRHRSGAIYKASNGTRIGIAVATERQPNRWFLGLREDAIDSAVLLCARENGMVYDICLPRELVQELRPRLSTSGDQVKFNVLDRGGHLFLAIPRRQSVQLDQYLGAIRRLG